MNEQDGFTCEPWGEYDKKIVAAKVMLRALKTATNYREKGIVLDMMLAAIKQAEEAGITTGENE